MLAQNFKTAGELKISDVELRSLMTVLGMLERQELVHGKSPLAGIARGPNEFNMAATLYTGGCGTIGCLAGWAYHVSGGEAFPEIIAGGIFGWGLRDQQLNALFGIGRRHATLYEITPARAATTLRRFLTTGDGIWL